MVVLPSVSVCLLIVCNICSISMDSLASYTKLTLEFLILSSIILWFTLVLIEFIVTLIRVIFSIISVFHIFRSIICPGKPSPPLITLPSKVPLRLIYIIKHIQIRLHMHIIDIYKRQLLILLTVWYRWYQSKLVLFIILLIIIDNWCTEVTQSHSFL